MANRKYGWQRDLPDHRDFKLIHATTSLLSKPSSFYLTPKMPPVYDQLQTSSCVGNACAAAFEFNISIVSQWTPSRMFIYYNARMDEGCQDSDNGTQIRDAIKALGNYGVVPETEWTFDPNHINDKPAPALYTEALNNKVVNYLSVVQSTDMPDKRIDLITTTIANGEPVVFGATLFDSFESDDVANTGIVPMPATTEGMVGGHAMLLVGYDDTTAMFTVRNSWGPDWGIKGYCKIPYAYISNPDLCSDFWVIRTIL